jgi:predicted nucleic acid-binding protein
MPDHVIADTSCLILFKKMDRLPLLYQVYGQITISPHVSAEFKYNLPQWVQVKALNDHKSFEAYRKIVDYGEASVIAFAIEVKNPLLIMDDKRGRQLATALDLPLTGTLGTILKAKRKGIINEVKPVLEDLKAIDFRISMSLEKFILNEAGE